jgi:hypothetical protein
LTGSTRTRAALVVALLGAGAAAPAGAQIVLEEFSYDQLRPSGLQADIGFLNSTDLEQTAVGGLRLDFGRFAPRVRVLLGVSFYQADFDARAIARFEERLRAIVIDPSGDDTVRIGRVTWSDVVADADLQYALSEGTLGVVFAGLGVSVHVRNGFGPAINGSFVEDALDGVTAGLNGMVGAEVKLGGPWRFTAEVRGVLSSELSTMSARFGAMYRFPDAP